MHHVLVVAHGRRELAQAFVHAGRWNLSRVDVGWRASAASSVDLAAARRSRAASSCALNPANAGSSGAMPAARLAASSASSTRSLDCSASASWYHAGAWRSSVASARRADASPSSRRPRFNSMPARLAQIAGSRGARLAASFSALAAASGRAQASSASPRFAQGSAGPGSTAMAARIRCTALWASPICSNPTPNRCSAGAFCGSASIRAL